MGRRSRARARAIAKGPRGQGRRGRARKGGGLLGVARFVVADRGCMDDRILVGCSSPYENSNVADGPQTWQPCRNVAVVSELGNSPHRSVSHPETKQSPRSAAVIRPAPNPLPFLRALGPLAIALALDLLPVSIPSPPPYRSDTPPPHAPGPDNIRARRR